MSGLSTNCVKVKVVSEFNKKKRNSKNEQSTSYKSAASHPADPSTTVKRPIQSKFSTRWPPIPIRSTYPGRTTAGRQLQTSHAGFCNRAPAGFTPDDTGSVVECLDWVVEPSISDGQTISNIAHLHTHGNSEGSVSLQVNVDLKSNNNCDFAA